jgi:hypothetical protein
MMLVVSANIMVTFNLQDINYVVEVTSGSDHKLSNYSFFRK